METKMHILLCEDEESLGMLVREYLQAKGYDAELFLDGESGLQAFQSGKYDMCLLDVMMPKMDGFALAKEIRAINSEVPIIFLTAKNLKDDILEGFKLGADDYLTKPFSMDILICKIEAILRRYRMGNQTNEMESDLSGLHFDAVRQTLGDRRLSSRENELLLMLCQNMDKTVERSRILMTLWGSDTYFNSRSLSVYVNHLRNYIGKDNLIKILSVHGKGYKLVKMNE